MSYLVFPIWKETPFLRLTLPLMLGILIQWNIQLWIWIGWMVFVIILFLFLRFSINDPFVQFKYYCIYGVFVNLLVVCLGILLCARQDYRNRAACILNSYAQGDWVIARLVDDPIEKSHSYKTLATVKYIRKNGEWLSVEGSIFIYTEKKKDSADDLNYGNILVFKKKMDQIRPSGNPGALNYQNFCAFQQIYLQVFLKNGDFFLLSDLPAQDLQFFLHKIRKKIVGILRRWVSGKKETGLAEALLIGYRNDLDPDLMQSYSNTGTVHIIAISGLHLALIYGLLRLILKPIYRKKSIFSAGPLISIFALWLFGFLSGASPSVLRSALMFTLIIAGECLSKKSTTYNGLFASAFLLLCYNPFWLWDPGFQLSYAAVLSILLFVNPIYRARVFHSKIQAAIWKSMAICLSAQILTAPISVYHFHQFPNYFLISNLLAVPLSSIILIGEMLICGISFLPWLAEITGKIVSFLCWVMNSSVEFVERLPYSNWAGLQIDFMQLVFLYVMIAGFRLGLIKKNKLIICSSFAPLLGFLMIRAASFFSAQNQQLLIVYNIPKGTAIDCLNSRACTFFGDSILEKSNSISRFYVRPARMRYRSIESSLSDSIKDLGRIYQWTSKRIVMIEHWNGALFPDERIRVDAIIISRNPNLQIRHLREIFDCSLWIFDHSNSTQNIRHWQFECIELGLHSYSVPDQGALVRNMEDGP